jgi:hypothetical protein
MTDPQIKHLKEMFATLESGRFQALVASGLLSDLSRCAAECDPTKVDRGEYQRILGVSSVFKVIMGGANNTDEITKALGFPFDELITQANFPLAALETPMEDEIETVDPGRDFSEEEGLQILKDKGLERPTYEHVIRFAEQHGKVATSEKKPFVIFLHEAWLDPDRCRRFVYLCRSARYRKLRLRCPYDRFRDRCVLAGVRPRKQPQS